MLNGEFVDLFIQMGLTINRTLLTGQLKLTEVKFVSYLCNLQIVYYCG